MQGVFAAAPVTADGQLLVNPGRVHRDYERIPYREGWTVWMRAQGWRRFGWYVGYQGPGLSGDWNGRLAPSHEFIVHLNRQPRKPNKTVESKHAGEKLDARGNIDTFLRQMLEAAACRPPDRAALADRLRDGRFGSRHALPDRGRIY